MTPHRTAAPLALSLALMACTSTDESAPPRPLPLASQSAAARAVANDQDLASRIAERLARPDRLGAGELFLEIERLMPSWQMEQRHGRQRPIEVRLTIEIVAHFDLVVKAFREGSHERREVSAWALGFSRVPRNDLGVDSPHTRAVDVLVEGIETADDLVMRNIMLALWRLGEPATPIDPLIDVLAHHHDPAVRANAALAIATTVTRASAARAVEAVTLAMGDHDPKVRLHAVTVAQRMPHETYTARIVRLLPHENMSLVRAAMAAALGRSGDPTSAPVLVPLLASSEPLEVSQAHQALVMLFGTDRGLDPAGWRSLVPTADQP